MSTETKTKHTAEPWPTYEDAHGMTQAGKSRQAVMRLSADDYDRARSCVNACAGMEDPAKAIKEALDSLRGSERLHRQRGDTMAAASCAAALRALGG